MGTIDYVMFDEFGKRSLGTFGALGRVTEPKDSIVKIHRGERVLSPSETADYNSATANQNATSSASNYGMTNLANKLVDLF